MQKVVNFSATGKYRQTDARCTSTCNCDRGNPYQNRTIADPLWANTIPSFSFKSSAFASPGYETRTLLAKNIDFGSVSRSRVVSLVIGDRVSVWHDSTGVRGVYSLGSQAIFSRTSS